MIVHRVKLGTVAIYAVALNFVAIGVITLLLKLTLISIPWYVCHKSGLPIIVRISSTSSSKFRAVCHSFSLRSRIATPHITCAQELLIHNPPQHRLERRHQAGRRWRSQPPHRCDG